MKQIRKTYLWIKGQRYKEKEKQTKMCTIGSQRKEAKDQDEHPSHSQCLGTPIQRTHFL